MLTEGHLKELIHQEGLTQLEQLLLCLAVDENKPKPIKQIREVALKAGLTSVKTLNIASVLARSDGKAIKTPDGWELRGDGRHLVEQLAGPLTAAPPPIAATSLRAHLTKIINLDTRDFVQQAILCHESKLYRAAVVLSWVGAVALLYEYVVTNKLIDFNAEATRRNSKWKQAKNADDLSKMGENDFLQIIEAISVIGKNVKQELENCLKLRNGCGHPNSLKLGEARVAAHIEILMLNVFVPPFSS